MHLITELKHLRFITIRNPEGPVVKTRKVLRPNTSTQVFLLVFLCLKANAEIVPNFPSCHYMLLMWPSLSKFIISVRKYVLSNHCHRVTTHLQ
jgi:hypothetical protein